MASETYSPVSIPKKNNGGRTKPKDAKIIIGRINDVETFPTPDAKGILISERKNDHFGSNTFDD